MVFNIFKIFLMIAAYIYNEFIFNQNISVRQGVALTTFIEEFSHGEIHWFIYAQIPQLETVILNQENSNIV